MTWESALVSATDSIDVLLDGGVEVNGGKVRNGEGLLLGELLDISLLQYGAADGRAVAALVAREVFDVVDGLGEGVGDAGFLLGGGWALQAVFGGQGHSGSVLRVGAGTRDLPRLLYVALQSLHQ